jgi:16S rRNA processing protein RimM
VGRPHGLDGSFAVEAPSEDPERLAVGARVYLDREPATVVGARRAGGRLVLRLDTPARRGAELEVPAHELAQLADGEFYAFQLVGLAVEQEHGRRLGTVVHVAPGIANDVLELDSGLALPLVEDCVRAVDLDAGRIVVAPGFAESI